MTIRAERGISAANQDPSPARADSIVLSQLAGAVAHKLKQPLAVAWGYMELLLEERSEDLDPTTLRYLQEINDSLKLMDRVIDRLQDTCGCQMRDYAGIGQILDLDQPRHPSCN